MDRGTRVFWLIVLTLFVASGYFGLRAALVQKAALAASATIQTGDLVRLVQLVDADTVVVTNAAGDRVIIRIIGVKALEAQGKDPVAVHSLAAQKAVEKALSVPARALVATPPRDKHGRVLATLFHDDEDVGLRLVRDGFLVVYTPFPFPAMQSYLSAQSKARAERRGLWSDDAAVARADAMAAAWRSGAE